jgi:hypothetical protein
MRTETETLKEKKEEKEEEEEEEEEEKEREERKTHQRWRQAQEVLLVSHTQGTGARPLRVLASSPSRSRSPYRNRRGAGSSGLLLWPPESSLAC